MSQQLINHNPDLKRLRDEGYSIRVINNNLVMDHVPYVNSQGCLQYGSLVAEISLAGDVTVRPATHVVFFTGEYPCDHKSAPLEKIRHGSSVRKIAPDVVIQHSFSSKPVGGYKDHYEKMTTYAAILSHPAESIDPAATAAGFLAVETEPDESVFEYVDTATSRAEIEEISAKLEEERITIIGLGGTGSYVLDLVAKTPVQEIELFDADPFSQHNAFRSPGAASIDELKEKPKKVDYFKAHYSRMHRRIVANAESIDATNVSRLQSASFVFICIDNGAAKRLIISELEKNNTPFIDVGMGVELTDGSLRGILRVTTSTPDMRAHVHEKQTIPLGTSASNEYSRNIQVADLNAMNATLAVIKWKKLRGFYADLEQEHYALYTVDGNTMTNQEKQ